MWGKKQVQKGGRVLAAVEREWKLQGVRFDEVCLRFASGLQKHRAAEIRPYDQRFRASAP